MGGGWAGVSEYFFTMNPNLKFFLEVGGGVDGARVSDFFYKESKSKKQMGRGMGRGGGKGRWTDRRTGLNQFSSSTSSILGAKL